MYYNIVLNQKNNSYNIEYAEKKPQKHGCTLETLKKIETIQLLNLATSTDVDLLAICYDLKKRYNEKLNNLYWFQRFFFTGQSVNRCANDLYFDLLTKIPGQELEGKEELLKDVLGKTTRIENVRALITYPKLMQALDERELSLPLLRAFRVAELELRDHPEREIFYSPSVEGELECLSVSVTKDNKVFVIGGRIGRGTYKNVYIAYFVNENRMISASKIKGAKEDIQIIEGMREAEILAEISATKEETYLLPPYIHVAHTGFKLLMFNECYDSDAFHMGPTALRHKVTILTQVGKGLKFLHKFGIVHLDLKPNNVVVKRNGGLRPVAKIIDFGAAKKFSEQQVIKSDYYAPPEAMRVPPHPNYDLWSWGGCIIGMIYKSEETQMILDRPYQAVGNMGYYSYIQCFSRLERIKLRMFEDLERLILANYPTQQKEASVLVNLSDGLMAIEPQKRTKIDPALEIIEELEADLWGF